MKTLFKLAFLVGLGALVVKGLEAKKEWTGLTETELRTKLSDKIGDKVPDDKLEEISNKVVDKMRDTGRLADESGAAGAEA
ncbi:MAG: hypothetical protein KJN71_00945 [Acidimicrobiia bacterium]|nr:hypothetical protein [Acidimicrobiia bacterium]NNC76008.1 hypothetical protein [Acidimicrobiia bacterium]